ncbi:uncharacterized protein LOC122056015 [Zingiber officinale]|uniref:DUF3741 domain-containing protein n=1 Tax=Zingiber officinale TaxID=94328 RepID=A0A8J5H0Y8_ZINOF|nr:uncharacterized protein LOC122056015 [Zingiber officinale]KAG6517678.1 hypothetical protein ZIOFF_021075 [Zingiber officinale]
MSTRKSSRMQLSEISQGAKRLTQMVCSLFKARNFVGRSKRIRDGLVKDASRAKGKLETERRLGVEDGEQFGSRSWRSCCHEEEVKKVIRESLLLSSCDDEKAYSSRSLGSYLMSDEFSSSYREAEEVLRIKNSRRPQSKAASPNLIARLMGLEELPATEPAADSAETKPKRCGNAPERVTLRSIIEREKAENHDGSGFSDSLGNELQESLKDMTQLLEFEDEERPKEVAILKKPSRMSRMHVSADCKQKLKRVDGRLSSDILPTHHRSSRKVSAAPLPQAMRTTATAKRGMESERSLAANSSTNPAKKTTGVTPAQKTSSREEEGTSPSSKKQDGDDDEPVINISPAVAEAAQQKQESSKSFNHEQSKKDPKSCCSGKSINVDLSNAKRGEVNHLENLLLNCHSFLLHAREPSIDDEPAGAANNSAEAKLYLSCAEELLLRKRRYDRELLTHHPLSATRSSEGALPVGDMVGYICERIRKLGDYSELGGGDARDGLYVRLERDLECKDVALNAVWDEGWREGVGWEAAAEVVGRVEQMVVTSLVEEAAVQLMK